MAPGYLVPPPQQLAPNLRATSGHALSLPPGKISGSSGDAVAVSNVNGYRLFPLRSQSIRDERQIKAFIFSGSELTNGCELIFINSAGFVKKPADQSGLAIVYASRGKKSK
jgi:hypothetical protein